MSLTTHLAELSEKHRALERKIAEETARPASSDQEIAKLKLEKLRIKEELERLVLTTRH